MRHLAGIVPADGLERDLCELLRIVEQVRDEQQTDKGRKAEQERFGETPQDVAVENTHYSGWYRCSWQGTSSMSFERVGLKANGVLRPD